MIESRTSLKNIAASTMTAFTPVMIVLTAVNCVVMDFAGSELARGFIQLALFFAAAAVTLIGGRGVKLYDVCSEKIGSSATAIIAYTMASALTLAAMAFNIVIPAGLAAGIMMILMFAKDKWRISGVAWWMMLVFFVGINFLFSGQQIIIIELVSALMLTVVPVCTVAAAMLHAREIKAGILAAVIIVLFGIIWVFGRIDYGSITPVTPEAYRKMTGGVGSRAEFDRMLQKAFGELMIPTLLPGHSNIRVYYRGSLANGYREVLKSMPYIAELAIEPRDSGIIFMPSLKDTMRMLSMFKNRENQFDVVIVDSGMDNPAAAAVAIPKYIGLAGDGFLVIANADKLSGRLKSTLSDAFKYRFQLTYPAKYTVYTNHETDMDLTRFDRDLARLFPNNPYVPPEIMSFLFSKVAEIGQPQEEVAAESKWPNRNILESGSPFVLWMGVAALAIYFVVRLVFGGREKSAVVLDGGEDGVFVGVASAMVILVCAAAEIMPVTPLICMTILGVALAGGAGVWARQIKYVAAIFIMIIAAAFIPYGWILWVALALFIFKVVPRVLMAIIIAAGITAMTAWGFSAGYDPMTFSAIIACAFAGPLFCDAFKPLRDRIAAENYLCAMTGGVATGIIIGAWFGAESLSGMVILMAIWRVPALLRIGRGGVTK